ncbi:MAG: hypothetical protein WBQ94_24800 [Terracidiphilus sp.]
MPNLILKVPHYWQDGPNCWWYVHKMIHDYHLDKNDWLTAFSAAPPGALPFAEIERVLGGLGYTRLTPPEFNKRTTTANVMDLLRNHGPLFIPCYETFSFKAGHALVLSSVVENKDGKFETKAEPWGPGELVVLLDPAAKTGALGSEVIWPLDYLKLLLGVVGRIEHDTQTPFYYSQSDRRKYIAEGPLLGGNK